MNPTDVKLNTERMLKWFEYLHFSPPIQVICKPFNEFATILCEQLMPGPERTVALRKLLESRDAAVRAKVSPRN